MGVCNRGRFSLLTHKFLISELESGGELARKSAQSLRFGCEFSLWWRINHLRGNCNRHTAAHTSLLADFCVGGFGGAKSSAWWYGNLPEENREAMPNPLDPDAVKLVNRALEELKKRNVKNDYCPRCETFDWDVEPVAIKVIPLQGPTAGLPTSYVPEYITAIQIVCKNCGYTMFHNLRSLGLAPWNT